MPPEPIPPPAGSPAGVRQNAFIAVRDLVAGYGGKIAVESISFDVAAGEHVSLLGPSGCGKSTTLRCIAGPETPMSGEIEVGGDVVFSSRRGVNLPPEKRNLAMVFQSYAIWPHMSVFENVAYGLRIKGPRGGQLNEGVYRALEMVGMREFADRQATDLSGGQQQRVALARSYAVNPRAILLDEPLSNLDARLRSRMREELKELQRKTHLSTIYVTHDQEEAMAISNRIIVMRDGSIEQIGAPLDIYNRPRSRFVADFIGAANVLAAEVIEATDWGARLKVDGAEIFSSVKREGPPPTPGSGQSVIVRTVYAKISATPFTETQNVWPATVVRRDLLGDLVAYIVEWPGGQLRINDFPAVLLNEGDKVFLHIPSERVVLVES